MHYKFQKLKNTKKITKNNLIVLLLNALILFNPFLLHDIVCWIKPYLKPTTSGLFCYRGQYFSSLFKELSVICNIEY